MSESHRDQVELWADYGAYDHVLLCQLYGPMIDLPQNIPMFTNEFQQYWRSKGCPDLPYQSPLSLHDALGDARHLKLCYESVSSSPIV